MRTLATRTAITIWIALLSVLFGVLAPALAQALPAPAAGEPMQVCTMAGMKTVVVDAGKPAPAVQHFNEHCQYCALHAATALPPPAYGFAFAVPAMPSRWPRLFFVPAAPQCPWTAACPRAPPVSV
jgi:hypothetical protein